MKIYIKQVKAKGYDSYRLKFYGVNAFKINFNLYSLSPMEERNATKNA